MKYALVFLILLSAGFIAACSSVFPPARAGALVQPAIGNKIYLPMLTAHYRPVWIALGDPDEGQGLAQYDGGDADTEVISGLEGGRCTRQGRIGNDDAPSPLRNPLFQL